MKGFLPLVFILISFASIAQKQKVESIHVNLYTDSLKKGTYNYINIDGLLSNGRYIPLDSTDLDFSASSGKFYGNSLWIDKNCRDEKIDIKVSMRNNPSLHKEFVMYIKKKEDDQILPTPDEIIEQMKKKKKGK